MTVAVVLGTRPEIIKLAPVIASLGDEAEVVFTGQHYDPELAGAIGKAFGLFFEDRRLAIGGCSRGAQIGHGTARLEHLLADLRPDAVIVQGDTNTTLAASLAANALQLPLVHVEAGLRSWDRAMPEEHNRVLVDHLADLCCAPTEVSAANLASEGIPTTRVAVTGNTVVEAVAAILPDPDSRKEILYKHGLIPAAYVLATFHRPENVDHVDPLEAWLRSLGSADVPVVLPLHPRTRIRIAAAGLGALLTPIVVTDPLPYRELLGLAAESAAIVSDSGGLQEEASIVKRPIAVVRRSTERPEVLGTFAELVRPGSELDGLLAAWLGDVDGVHERLADLPCPYGDGRAAQRTLAALRALVPVHGG